MNEQYHRIGKDGRKYWGKVGAGILYTDGKRVLLLKRATKGDHYGSWSIPGGKVERGENPLDAAQRESKEETGVFDGSIIAHYDDVDHRHHFHTFLYKVDQPFQCQLSDEHSEYRWVELPDVEDLKLHPRFRAMFPRFRRKIGHHFPKSFAVYVSEKDATQDE